MILELREEDLLPGTDLRRAGVSFFFAEEPGGARVLCAAWSDLILLGVRPRFSERTKRILRRRLGSEHARALAAKEPFRLSVLPDFFGRTVAQSGVSVPDPSPLWGLPEELPRCPRSRVPERPAEILERVGLARARFRLAEVAGSPVLVVREGRELRAALALSPRPVPAEAGR